MKNVTKRVLAVLLCLTMICAVGCTPNDDTTVTTTTQEITTTTMVTDTTTTVEDATTTTENVTTTKDNGTTVTTTATKNDGTTTTKVTTTAATTTTTNQTTTTKYDGPVRVITCYGDSVTEGMGVGPNKNTTATKGLPYPQVLQQILGAGYQVQNAGDGGEKTQSIMVRQGALKIHLKNDVTFAAGETQVQIDEGSGRGVLTEDGKEVQWTPPYGRDLPMNKVTINGKAYEFKFTDHNYEQHGTCKTFLTRENGSETVTLPKGTEVVINTATTSKSNYCDIYLMGFNGDYTDVNDLIAQHQKMIAYRGNNNYLIIIPFFGKNSTANVQAFKDAFGDHAVDFLAYSMDTNNYGKAGLTATNNDKMCIRQKIMPYRFKLYGSTDPNDVHLSADGYKLLAQALHEQGKKINLW